MPDPKIGPMRMPELAQIQATQLGTDCEGAKLRVNFGIGWRSFPGC